jgi:hypothetical protein
MFPAINLVEAALSLLVKTDGDLAGWLGGLAPRGDLDSTQLLYRIFGVNIADVHKACRGASIQDNARCQAAMCLTSQGLPLLSLAFRMMNTAASAAVRSSKGGGAGAVQGSTSSTSTGGASDGGRAGAHGKDAEKAQASQHRSSGSGSGKHPQPGHFGSSRTASGRSGPSFTQAWAQSPLSLQAFALPCMNMPDTKECMTQVGMAALVLWHCP